MIAAMSIRELFLAIDVCIDELRNARSVEDVITTIQSCLGDDGDHTFRAAFWPGSLGQLSGALTGAGFKTTWTDGECVFVVRDAHGDYLTYVEGDIMRGDTHIDG